jgi:DNA-binding IclR family transcriptional regulator
LPGAPEELFLDVNAIVVPIYPAEVTLFGALAATGSIDPLQIHPAMETVDALLEAAAKIPPTLG